MGTLIRRFARNLGVAAAIVAALFAVVLAAYLGTLLVHRFLGDLWAAAFALGFAVVLVAAVSTWAGE